MIANSLKLIAAALFLLISVGGIVASAQTSTAAPIAILGIPEETELLTAQLTDKKEVKIAGIVFEEGKLHGRQVVLCRMGFGKVNAALAATLVIEHYKPEAVIFTGAAGALNPDLILGDIVVGTNSTQHDFGMLSDKSSLTPLGFTHWRTRNPITNEKNPLYFTPNEQLLRAAREGGQLVKLERVDPDTKVRDPKVIEGVIATGDLFVSEKTKNYELAKYLDADAVEMEGAAVAQISWQFGVPCLIIRSISDTASGSSLPDYYKFVKIAARNSSSLVLEMLPRLGPATPLPPASEQHTWKVAFELAFGKDSPYSTEFPDLYQLPYDVNLVITKEVLDQIIAVALKETDAKQVSLNYRAGGFQDFPAVPSAQLEIQATDAAARDLMNIVGYLAQQTAVIASHRTDDGNRRAITIVEKSGTALANVKTLEAFWRRLGESSPKLQPGFSAIEVAGKPGLYIIDSDGDWLAKDFPKFKLVTARVSQELGLTTDFTDFVVEYSELGNNWKLDTNGEQYLRRFSGTGQTALRQRLEGEYRLNAHAWIRKAFETHAPQLLIQPATKKMELLIRPRLNTVTTPVEKGSWPEYIQNP